MQTVTAENGIVHEFPDEATPEMIAKAMGVSTKPTSVPSGQLSTTPEAGDTPVKPSSDPAASPELSEAPSPAPGSDVLGMSGEQFQNPDLAGTKQWLAEEGPAVGGGMATGIAAGAAGIGALPGALGIAGMVSAVGTGAMAGEAYRQIGQHLSGSLGAPTTSLEAAKRIGKAAIEQGGFEAVGGLAAKGFGKIIAPYRKTITKGIQDAADYFRGKIEPVVFLPAEAAESRSLDLLHNIADASLIGGNQLAKFKTQRLKFFDDFADSIIDQFGQRTDPTDLGNLFVNSIENKLATHKEASTMLYNGVEEEIAAAGVRQKESEIARIAASVRVDPKPGPFAGKGGVETLKNPIPAPEATTPTGPPVKAAIKDLNTGKIYEGNSHFEVIDKMDNIDNIDSGWTEKGKWKSLKEIKDKYGFSSTEEMNGTGPYSAPSAPVTTPRTGNNFLMEHGDSWVGLEHTGEDVIIHDVYVPKSDRGQGKAGQLLSDIEKVSTGKTLWLGSTNKQMDRAAEKAGFEMISPRGTAGNQPIFYRGTGSEEQMHHFSPDVKKFVARNRSTALEYGPNIEQLQAKSGAKILTEESPEFAKLTGVKNYNPKKGIWQGNLEQRVEEYTTQESSPTEAFINMMVEKAQKRGYDAVSFSEDYLMGTAIINESAFTNKIFQIPEAVNSRTMATYRKVATAEIPSEIQIPTASLKEFARRAGASGADLGGIEARNAGDDLLAAVADLPDAVSFDTMKELRSRLISRIDEFSVVNKKAPAIGKAKKLIGLSDGEIESTLSAESPELIDQWRTANRFYREGQEKFNNVMIRRLMKLADDTGTGGEMIAPSIFKPGQVSRVRRVKEALEPEEWTKMQGFFVQHLLSKSTDADGQIVGKRILSNLEGKPGSFGPEMIREVFTPKQAEALHMLGQAMQTAQSGTSTGSGRVLIQLSQAGMVGTLATAGLTPLAATVIIGPSVLSKMMLNPVAAKWLTQGFQLPANSVEAGGVLVRLLNEVGKYADRSSER